MVVVQPIRKQEDADVTLTYVAGELLWIFTVCSEEGGLNNMLE
jgi:hypothetical protein